MSAAAKYQQPAEPSWLGSIPDFSGDAALSDTVLVASSDPSSTQSSVPPAAEPPRNTSQATYRRLLYARKRIRWPVRKPPLDFQYMINLEKTFAFSKSRHFFSQDDNQAATWLFDFVDEIVEETQRTVIASSEESSAIGPEQGFSARWVECLFQFLKGAWSIANSNLGIPELTSITASDFQFVYFSRLGPYWRQRAISEFPSTSYGIQTEELEGKESEFWQKKFPLAFPYPREDDHEPGMDIMFPCFVHDQLQASETWEQGVISLLERLTQHLNILICSLVHNYEDPEEKPARAVFGVLTQDHKWAVFVLCSQLGRDLPRFPNTTDKGSLEGGDSDAEEDPRPPLKYIMTFRRLAEGRLDAEEDSYESAKYFVFVMQQLHLHLQEIVIPAIVKLINKTAEQEGEEKHSMSSQREQPTMMQLKPYYTPFVRKMFDRKSSQLVFIEEGNSLVEEPEEITEEEAMMIPKGKETEDESKKYGLSDGEVSGIMEIETQISTARSETAPSQPQSTADTASITEGIKHLQFDIPVTPPRNTPSPSMSKRSPPIRRPSTTVRSLTSSSGVDTPQSAISPSSRRAWSFPRTLEASSMETKATAQAERPMMPRRESTMSPPPPPPPKPAIPPLKRRATTPAESQASRQLVAIQNAKFISLPCLDITQNGRAYRESDLLVDLLNVFKSQWPERPYAVMNHLRNSLMVAIAAYDDPKPLFASNHGGDSLVKQVAGRFRRYRGDKTTIDLSLVVWNESFMSFREQCFLQETHRYRPQKAGDSTVWPGAQRVVWYPSWEPSKNLPSGFAESFSREKERIWSSGGEDIKFEVQISDGDWC